MGDSVGTSIVEGGSLAAETLDGASNAMTEEQAKQMIELIQQLVDQGKHANDLAIAGNEMILYAVSAIYCMLGAFLLFGFWIGWRAMKK